MESKKSGKEMRLGTGGNQFWENIVLGFKTPHEAIEVVSLIDTTRLIKGDNVVSEISWVACFIDGIIWISLVVLLSLLLCWIQLQRLKYFGREKALEKNSARLATAGFFCILTFSWMNPLLLAGVKKPLSPEDIPSVVPDDEAELAYNKFSHPRMLLSPREAHPRKEMTIEISVMSSSRCCITIIGGKNERWLDDSLRDCIFPWEGSKECKSWGDNTTTSLTIA
ncbi:unnamed protein product [Thlaspi arvense]|uniref:Uncharacterized protein n=1 Tax=Thlaspi arvense TaxID=13288 RepID=A0AAU9RPU2_THLAR|nr:unnamed protein product [Thlaspi arvense]